MEELTDLTLQILDMSATTAEGVKLKLSSDRAG
jgi:hypothetical protein